MTSETSGWYARLDHECPDRVEQIEIWLDAWLLATKQGQPIAATLPRGWPTLPAGLLSDPGSVLDRLLARHEAESDGRSPRGVYAMPVRFVDAILCDELQHGRNRKREPPATLSLTALPPSFRVFAEQLNESIRGQSFEGDCNQESDESRTLSGIPLPFADPSVGAGLFADRIIRMHADRCSGMDAQQRKEDTLRLLEGFQMVDASDIAVESARKRLLIVLARLRLVDLDGEGGESLIGRSEANLIIESNVRCADPLRGEWPWNESPRLLVSRPPWLRIKDRFRGHPEGSQLRKNLSKELRQIKGPDGSPRFSAIEGNVNLYRLYIERSLQLSQKGGRVRMVVPESVLREKSSAPLRKLIVSQNEWDSVWSFPDDQQLPLVGAQGVSVLGITVAGTTEVLTSFGPLRSRDISSRKGLDKGAPFLELERGPWSIWTDTSWAVPKMPKSSHERNKTLRAIGTLADQPRLIEEGTWLNPSGKAIRVRVGGVDCGSWSSHISDWGAEPSGSPFIRGTHIELNDGEVNLRHPAFADVPEGIQWSQAVWNGPSDMLGPPRIICQAMINPQMERRLLWAVIPSGCVLGNSVSFLDLPNQVVERLVDEFGDLEEGLAALASHLNSEDLNLWSKAWAANNNVNNYEIEMLPFPPLENAKPISLLGNDSEI